ncbi:ABC transporter ATP-binding protein [Facklamia miroungae]|uniref:ATP-binding cassette, subfamily B/ATP-binding cassette, subfamily B, tetracycline resistant protein n=1 Tax=Facklamia miroungae TaxID=120956 RepID=A0A1G7PTE4_9LACT|nr:ABC transporter ATP-binding protein [Facklamia miroungae]NKZ28824.1 ABC transporter ATP-binding protein [Facklamia miroungae]SDF89597.1 ATP-binding cassette, subfamily B/ATP-binding cassette, subfamily B, tetracycline resistant protein [Facklamia miroungae]
METLKRLLSYLKYAKWKFALGVLFLIFSVGLSVYAPLMAKDLIDYAANQVTNKQVIEQARVVNFFVRYVLILVSSAVLSYTADILMAFVANQLSKKVRDQAHQHMQTLPVSYFDDKPAGKIAARIVNDTEVLRQSFYQNFCNRMLINLMTVIGIYVALLYVSLKIGLFFLLFIPIFIVWQIIYMRKITPVNTKWRESVSELNSKTAEIIQGVTIVQAYGQEEMLSKEFEETNEDWYQSRIQSQKIDSRLSWSLADLLKNIGILLVVTYLGTQYLEGVLGISVGKLYVLINYVSRLFDPITQIVRLMTMLQQSLVSGSRVFALIDHPSEKDQTNVFEMGEGRVSFKDVNFAYQGDQKVLKNINFEVEPGQTIGLVGHTGSGKSSIINLIFRFYDPQEGQILIDGQDIQHYSRESVRADMGIVLQEPYLFSGTIASNVSMNDPKISKEKILQSIEQVGAKDMIAKLEKGIDEEVVEKGQSLSSGERQLISFARTLASDPKILILDEATSHIDTETENVIQEAMKVLQKGRTTFIIAHRLSTIQHADQIILMDNGEIKEQGNHDQLMALNGQYAEMYRMQAKVS